MIKSIELSNWKTHKDTKLSFSKGINILIGQMGSGKSSLIDAISFALFGTFPAVQHKRVNVSRLIRNKPEQEKEAHVNLTLELGGDTYVIKRGLTLSGKATATLEKNGAYLQSQPERVTEEVAKILKADYDLFSKAIYSEQNQLDYFLDIRPQDRKKQIDGLLGLDKFATAQDNATSLVNKIMDMVEEGERITREFDIDKAAAELKELKEGLGKLEAERKDAEADIKLYGSKKSDLDARMAKMKEQNARKISLSKEIEGIRSRISLLESEIKKLDSKGLPNKEDAQKTRKSLQEQLDKLKDADKKQAEAERKLQSDAARLEAEISNAKKERAEKEKIEKEMGKDRKVQTEKGIAECNESIDKIAAELAHSKSAISDAQGQMKELTEHVGKCPVCERELDKDTVPRILKGKEKLIEEHKAKSKELDIQLSKAKANAKELNSLLNSLTVMAERLKAIGSIDERLKASELAHSRTKEEYGKARTSREANEKSINEISDSVQKINTSIEAIERLERHVSDREKLSKELSGKAKEHDGIDIDERQMDAIQSELVKVNSEISKHTANLGSTVKYLKEKELQVKGKESDIEKIKRMHEDIAKKKVIADNVSKFKVALAETQSVLRVQLINSINEIMQEVWKNLYPYGDYQSVSLDAADDGYDLKVKTLINNEYVWENVEAIASGGERSTACLAMRVAFSLVLVPNLKWLILDEPTHNIDSEGISKFVEMFSQTLPGIIDQVFIITHDDMLKQVSNARIYLLNRNKEENRETQVIEV